MLIIDRFEGEYALIETDKKVFPVPKVILPKDAKEGDVIQIIVDEEATAAIKKKVQDLADDLFKD